MRRFGRLITVIVTAALMGICAATRSAKADAASAALNRRLPEVKFDAVGLSDCIDFLRDLTGANIEVNWRVLQESNVNKDTPVTLRLYSVPLRKALSVILNQVSGGDALTYFNEENVIEVTTKAEADKVMYTRVFPVEDLLVDVPDFTDSPKFDLTSSSSSGGSGGKSGGSSGSSGSIFNQGGSAQSTDAPGKTKTDRANDLVKLITTTIQPDVWRDNGGTASIGYFNGSLIVTAPRSVLEAIGGSFD